MLVNGDNPNNVTVLQCGFFKRNNNVTMLNNVGDSDKAFRNKQLKTESIADSLVKKFSAPEWRQFFLKAAWRLSEDAIWSTAEKASSSLKVKQPLHYFIAACNKQMGN